MRNIGAAMVGGNGMRRDGDFYPTPRAAVDALFSEGILRGGLDVWEPACGDGAMARVLTEYGCRVVASDIADRGFGETGVDFLQCSRARAPLIVTNPPFNLAESFIRHAHTLDMKMLLLLKATFWHAASRVALWDLWTPAAIYPLTWRLDFDGRGAPTMDCSWVYWSRPLESGALSYYRPISKGVFA